MHPQYDNNKPFSLSFNVTDIHNVQWRANWNAKLHAHIWDMLFSYHDSGSVCWSEICQQVVFGLPVLRNAVNYGHLCRRHPICHQASQFSVSSAELFYIDI